MSLRIPFTATNLPEWIRKVATSFNLLVGKVEAAETAGTLTEQGVRDIIGTGWGAYIHGGPSTAVSAATDTYLTNDMATALETQLPSDMATFYDGTSIWLKQGDAAVILASFRFVPNDAAASRMTVCIEIPTLGKLDFKQYEIIDGAGVEHIITYDVPIFAGAAFAANGARFVVRCDGPGMVLGTDRYFRINRTHRGVL